MYIGDPSNFKRVQTIFDSDLRKMKNMIYAFSFSDIQTKNAIKEGKFGEAALKGGLTALAGLGTIPLAGKGIQVAKAAAKRLT